jgi:hypothetical protein
MLLYRQVQFCKFHFLLSHVWQSAVFDEVRNRFLDPLQKSCKTAMARLQKELYVRLRWDCLRARSELPPEHSEPAPPSHAQDVHDGSQSVSMEFDLAKKVTGGDRNKDMANLALLQDALEAVLETIKQGSEYL